MSAPGSDAATLPDLIAGVSARTLPVGTGMVGRVGEDAVLLLHTAEGLRAVQATCPHYGAPLLDGCVHDGRIHCPWHHASFDLADGTVLRPPALDRLRTWRVEERRGRIRVLPHPQRRQSRRSPPRTRETVVVVGAGAAGVAAALTLREAGHRGPLLLVDPDPAAPYDRPNLSKDYLAGTAPEEWLPLRVGEDWDALGVERVIDSVIAASPDDPVLELGGGRTVEFDGLILATGAEPRTLTVPGSDGEYVFTLRSLDDCRAIRARAQPGTRAVVVGAGFIGLEASAALRSRDVEVSVVAPEAAPLRGVLGPELAAELLALHERMGVRFHLGTQPRAIEAGQVRLDDGTLLPADLVLVGVGVKPRLTLAIQAGLEVQEGVVVDPFLESSRKGVYAAGDIASFPDPRDGRVIRIEHWAVAQAQGRTAAFNLLGHRRRFLDVPFFWTSHYDVTVRWSGFPGAWDQVETDGSLHQGSLAARFMRDGVPLAAAFVGRDREALRWELAQADEIGELDE